MVTRGDRNGARWWLRNLVGKQVIDLMNFDGREQAASLEEIELSRTRLLARPAVLALH